MAPEIGLRRMPEPDRKAARISGQPVFHLHHQPLVRPPEVWKDPAAIDAKGFPDSQADARWFVQARIVRFSPSGARIAKTRF